MTDKKMLALAIMLGISVAIIMFAVFDWAAVKDVRVCTDALKECKQRYYECQVQCGTGEEWLNDTYRLGQIKYADVTG